ncbi:MAG: hypothetical protein R3F49_14800 [Planctomycetota bacterium]
MDIQRNLGLAALTLTLLAACRSSDGATATSPNADPAASRATDAVDAGRATVEAATTSYGRPGFHTAVVDGRLWVLREGSDALAEFLASGEPAKSVTLPGRGPGGITLRGASRDELEEYLLSRPGYYVKLVDGRLWVLRAGSEALTEFLASGEPAKSVTFPGRGPGGITVRSSDRETVDAYLGG